MNAKRRDPKTVTVGAYLQRMGPFLLRRWKLVAAIVLAAGIYNVGSYSRALMAKPFLEKIFLAPRAEAATKPAHPGAAPARAADAAGASEAGASEAGAASSSTDARLPEAEPEAEEAAILKHLPAAWRKHKWVRVLASLTDKRAVEPGVDVRDYFYILCVIALGLSVLLGLGMFMRIYLSRLVINLVTLDLRNYTYSRLVRFDVAFFDKHRSGDLLARVTADLLMAQRALDELASHLVDKPIGLLIGFCTCLILSWKLSLICFFGLPLLLFPVGYLAKKIRKGAAARQERLGDITDAMVQTFNGIRVIKAFGLEEQETTDFGNKNRQYFRKDMNVARARAMSRASTELVYTAGIALLMMGLGGYMITAKGEIGFGGAPNIVAFFLALGLMYQPLKLLIKAWNIFQESAAGAQRLFDVTEHVSDVSERDGATQLVGVREAVRYEGVRFDYGAGDVLRGIDIEVPVGSTVAVVGPSGAGKSTLLDLIPRFYDVTDGRVSVDGHDVREFTLQSLYAHIAVVQQDPFLFNTTIRENIRLGRPGASDAEVVQAARAAQVDTFVSALPAGYDTPCGERGSLLSGGERQRVTIARAMLKDAPILLLDEATSSLDTGSEREVQRALEVLMEGRTTLVIAHRLSTVRHADLIVVMSEGKVVETGTHDELVAAGSLYAHLHRMQHPDAEE